MTDRGTDAAPLAGLHVLVTRPAALAGPLCAAIAREGGDVHLAPLVAIEPLPVDARRRAIAQDLDRYDLVIVTSRNAVQHGLALLGEFWPQWPVQQRWLAVGGATAAALADAGIDAIAPADARSEGLLAMPALADVDGRRVLLLTGEGGRGLLEDALAARGARLDRLAVYRRAEGDARATLDAFRDIPATGARRVALVTSGEALQNLLRQAPWFAEGDVHVVVASDRLARLARDAGLAHVTDAQGADDAHLLAALHALAAHCREDRA